MRRGRLWVGAVAAALVAVSGSVAGSGSVAQAAPAAAAPAVGTASGVATAAEDVPGAMHVLPARRVLDTRSGLGAAAGARPGGSTTAVTVLGRGGVPASGVGAVLLHVTVTGATGSGHVTAYPAGAALPTASTLNVTAGQNITNMTVVPVGASGAVALRYTGSGTVHLVADVAGWVAAGAPTEPGTTGTLTPARLMDTRSGLGGRTGALGSGGLARLRVTGRGGVPASVGSVTLNVTVVTPTTGGWLAVTPVDPGAGLVTTSSVNFVAGRTIANAVTTAVSPTGTIDLRLSTGPSAHVVVDVVAWTVPGTGGGNGTLTAQAPTRLLDTRAGARPTAGAALEVAAGSAGGAILNVTAVGAESAGYLTVSGSGAGTPVASQLSFPAGAARAAQVYVPGGTAGRVRITLASAATHVVVDQVATVAQPLLTVSDPLPLQQVVGHEATTTGTQIGWSAAPAGTASIVVQRRKTGTPRSPYDGTRVWSGPGTSALAKDPSAQPWQTYQYAVFARDAAGNWSEAARTDATGAPMRWTGGARYSPYRGAPQDVSCPTATWCMAVDMSGQALRWNGSAWSSPTAVVPTPDEMGNHWMGFRSVSCPTTHFCLASLVDSRLATWRDGTWSVTPAPWDVGEVSCWSETSCGLAIEAAAGASWDFARWTSGTLSGAVDVGYGTGGSLSCPTSTCYLARVTGSPGVARVHRISGTSVSSHRLLGDALQHPSVSCTTATWCMVATEDKFATMSGSTWSALRDLGLENGEDVRYAELSCATPTSCTAVGMATVGIGAARWNGASWTIRTLTSVGWNTRRAVDCATSSACMVVDSRGRFNRWTGSSWTARATFDLTRGGVEDLDCTTASACVATDGGGNVLTWSGGDSWALRYLSENHSGLDCAGSLCVTVDWLEGTYRTRKSGTWGPTSRPPGGYTPSDAVLCASSSRCFALGWGDYLTFNGSRWSAEPTRMPVDLGDAYYIRGDCPTTTFCLAYNGLTRASMTWNGSRWTSRGKIPVDTGAWAAADCLSASFCMAKGFETSAVLTASGWHASAPSPPAGGDVACRTTTHCIVVSNSVVWTWDGSRWSETSQRLGDYAQDTHVTCVGTARCVVTVGDRIWWTP